MVPKGVASQGQLHGEASPLSPTAVFIMSFSGTASPSQDHPSFPDDTFWNVLGFLKHSVKGRKALGQCAHSLHPHSAPGLSPGLRSYTAQLEIPKLGVWPSC